MLKNKLAKLLYLCGLGLLLVALLPATASNSKGIGVMSADKNPSPYRKVVVHAQNKVVIAKLQAAGAIELTPPEWREGPWLGGNTIWNVPVEQMQRLSTEVKLNVKDEYDKIQVNGVKFYPLAGEPPIPDNLRQSKRDGKQMWMLHYLQPHVHGWLGERGILIVRDAGPAGLVVWLDDKQLAELEAAVNPNGPILWAGAYHPYYRIAPELRAVALNPTRKVIRVNVLAWKQDETAQALLLAKLQEMSVYDRLMTKPQSTFPESFSVAVEIYPADLVSLAQLPQTILIDLYPEGIGLDEIPNQVIAGNITPGPNTGPNGAGYLSWLTNDKDFPTDPNAYPPLAVVDSGLDDGNLAPAHPAFYELGSKTNPSRVIAKSTCVLDGTTYDRIGHGTLVAGIIGAYNAQTVPPHQDGAGYNRGVGVSPFGRLVNLKLLDTLLQTDVVNCNQSYDILIDHIRTSGAKISNNSWGFIGINRYDAFAALYDRQTRGSAANPQPLLHVFAAGNANPNVNPSGSIMSPGVAKNVLSVGATQSVRDAAVQDGCKHVGSANMDDIAPYSSRGLTQDGRAKPDVVAPGTHIQGPASQESRYNGSRVCGGRGNRFIPFNPDAKYYPFPAGPEPISQTLYTLGTGTSYATPVVAGAAQLTYNYYKRVLDPGKEPSPAMAKALLINSARYLSGVNGGDRLPSPAQGWGMINLGTLFGYTPNNTFVLDQSSAHIFAGSGGVAPVQFYGRVADKTKPVRFTLVWTDAPGQPGCSSCLVNNLDLEVNMFGGTTYLGNVFDTQFSETGGSFDIRNNVENVYLATNNANQRFVVRILPALLQGDGVPGNGFLRDQDFALVIHNATIKPGPETTFERQTVSVNDGSGGNSNNAPEPNELIYVDVQLKNTGSQDAVAVSSLLSLNPPQPAVTLVDERSTYLDILTNAAEKNQTPFSFRLEPTFDCGTPVTLSQATIYNGSVAASSSFTVATGSFGLGTPHVHSNNTPRVIANDTTTVSTILVPGSVSGRVAKLRLTLDILHSMNNELRVNLIAPNGQTALLFSGIGGTQGFQNITFDDAATHTLSEVGSPQPNHTYKPPVPFSEALNDTSTGLAPTLAGTWRLEIQHTQYTITRTGSLQSWSLSLQRNDEPVCLPYTPDAAKFVTAQDGTPQSGAIGTVFLPLQARVTDTKGNPIRGIPVTFQAPANGASGTFPNGSRTLVANTDVDGLATANSLRANNQPGSYLVTAGVGVSGASPAQFALTNVAGEATSLSIASGNQQGTLPNSPFGAPLVVQLRDSAGNPVAGQGVTFTPPDTRAGGIAGGDFSGTPDIEGSSWTVFTDNSGRATAPTLTANEIVGNYVVVASSGQLSGNFSLHNLTACPNGITPFVVTSASDDGSGLNCGTLSRALLQAVSGTTISFSLGGTSTVAVAGSLPPIRAGVTLSGGSSCGANLLTLNGTGTSGTGLRLEGRATLQNLRVRGFGQPQIEASNAGSGGCHLSQRASAKINHNQK